MNLKCHCLLQLTLNKLLSQEFWYPFELTQVSHRYCDYQQEHFDKLCIQANISGVNGHRSVGGYRASIYNALELSSVQVLIEVMEELKTKV